MTTLFSKWLDKETFTAIMGPVFGGYDNSEEKVKRRVIFLPVMAVLLIGFNSTAWALLDVPKSGTFLLDDTASSPVDFDPVPWVSPGPAYTAYMFPFASDDMYSGMGIDYHLAQIAFSNGSYIVDHIAEKTGDMGIRIGNYSPTQATFAESTMTLHLTDEDFDIYLPEFTLDQMDNIFLWVAESGATYFANSAKGAGLPDIFADTAMNMGTEYLARVPEPSTILLLTLGGLMIRRGRLGHFKARF